MPDAFEQVDALFEKVVEAEHVPGVAYGVVIGGELVHARGLGATRANASEPTSPDADSVFRIASMTKSFTAATTLLLRDEGLLHLDEPVGTYVPELEGFKGPTADSPPVAVRHLLTMSSGLPTDDPWGDRLQGMALDRFAELLRGGFEFAWTPGTAFEYSNLGYGILGRVLTNVSGLEYRDLVRQRLLEPLGMSVTTYDVADVPAERLVQGHVRRDDAFIDEPFDGYGALASMGGIFSSVRDLATWVASFTDAFPPRDDPEGPHPLSRASRREMQQVQRTFDPELKHDDPAGLPSLDVTGYGFGLFVSADLAIGHVVGHSGGYPGFGSHMRWHPASGIGVIALGNRTYAPMMAPCVDALIALVTQKAAPVRSVARWDATDAALADIERLLAAWDDELAARLFAFNVALDEPLERRRATLESIRDRFGVLTRDEREPIGSESPSDLAWWMRGERGGRVRVEILLNAERPPRVQSMDIREVPEPSPALRALAERVADLLSGEPPAAWPDDLRPAGTVEATRDGADRSLRAAAAMFGPVAVADPTHCESPNAATFPLRGDRGALTVTLAVDRNTGKLTDLVLRPDRRTPPTGRHQ
jgi:CubicO group peptidase (beta-lactamase class C family)